MGGLIDMHHLPIIKILQEKSGNGSFEVQNYSN